MIETHGAAGAAVAALRERGAEWATCAWVYHSPVTQWELDRYLRAP